MKEYLDIALRAALEAGAEILRIYTDPSMDFEVEKKADNSPLTIADRHAHEVIQSHLVQTPFPILSEEGKKDAYESRKDWETFWCVDPLDGTKEFIKRNGMFSVNIALLTKDARNYTPTLGVVFFPWTGMLYWSDGEVARRAKVDNCTDIRDIEQLPVASEIEKRPYTIVASASHMSAETEAYINDLRTVHPDLQLVQAGSSLKICRVAEGSADIYPRLGPTCEWDTAAGHAVALAAGFNVYQCHMEGNVCHEGAPLEYNKENLLNPYFVVK